MRTPTSTSLYLLMQVNDAVFPIGSYNHSYGLESYIAYDKIKNKADAIAYISSNLKIMATYTELLSASLAFDYAETNCAEKLCELDKTLLALKSAKEIREASLKLGNRFIKTITSMGIVMKFVHLLNYSVIYGAFCSGIEVDKRTALEFYIYSQVSAVVINCVKTVPLSQTEGQQILHEMAKEYDEIIDKVLAAHEEDLGLASPAYDIRCMQHEALYSRLYMS